MSFVVRIFIVLFITLLLEFYFYKKFLTSLKILFSIDLKKYRLLIWSVIIFLNLYLIIVLGFWTYTQFTGERFRFIVENSFWDFLVLYPYWISVMMILQVVFIILPVDLIRQIIRPFTRKYKNRINKINYGFTFVVVLFFLIYVPARVIYDFNAVEVRTVNYSIDSLPKDLKGFKIAFIADIQADWYTNEERLNNYLQKVNSTEPDLILMAGDIITGSPDYINTGAEQLSKLKAEYGVFTCVGDHDNWAYRSDMPRSRREITAALAKYDIHMIDNEYRSISVDSATIGIAFITESYSKRIGMNELDSLVGKTSRNDLRIVLSHQPADKIINSAIENNADLMLAGHTHGGQITFLYPFFNLTPTIIETKHVKGDFYYDELLLIVNRGLGMSLVPIRYNSTPEITVINFE